MRRKLAALNGEATGIFTRSIHASQSMAPRAPTWRVMPNHSCNPNAETYSYGGRVFIRALRRIKPDEEITYDYGNDYLKYVIGRSRCRCGRCRRRRARKQREARALKKRRAKRHALRPKKSA